MENSRVFLLKLLGEYGFCEISIKLFFKNYKISLRPQKEFRKREENEKIRHIPERNVPE